MIIYDRHGLRDAWTEAHEDGILHLPDRDDCIVAARTGRLWRVQDVTGGVHWRIAGGGDEALAASVLDIDPALARAHPRDPATWARHLSEWPVKPIRMARDSTLYGEVTTGQGWLGAQPSGTKLVLRLGLADGVDRRRLLSVVGQLQTSIREQVANDARITTFRRGHRSEDLHRAWWVLEAIRLELPDAGVASRDLPGTALDLRNWLAHKTAGGLP